MATGGKDLEDFPSTSQQEINLAMKIKYEKLHRMYTLLVTTYEKYKGKPGLEGLFGYIEDIITEIIELLEQLENRADTVPAEERE